MKKLMILTASLTLLALAFGFGFAGAAHAQATTDLDALTLDLSDDSGERLDHRGKRGRALRGLRKAVGENCDCGDVECADDALDTKIAEILANLPEDCDADCQTAIAEKLAEAKAKILERVQAAADDPTLCEREPREPGGRGRPGRGGGGNRP